MSVAEPTPRTVLRVALIVVGVVAALYLGYLLRKPLAWLLIAAFIAIAVSGPVNVLSRRMRRGFAIALVYLGLILIPVAVIGVLVPPLIGEGRDLVESAPEYAADLTDFVNENETLNALEQEYDITGELQQQAADLPSKVDDAAGALRDVGVGIVNSVFAGVTILLLSVFMVAGNRRWAAKLLARQPPDRAQRIRRALDRIAAAVGNYVAGALLQALIAGVTTFAVLTVLGVPFAAPLAVVVALLDLVPLIGATLGAVVVGIVTLFTNFPSATIVWTVWAIVYQQVENNVIQPQIQRRALQIEPIVVLVSVLFGATLFGVLGALMAIPFAASAQIALREYLLYRHELAVRETPGPGNEVPATR